MRKIILYSLLLLASLSLWGQEERVYSFHSDIYLDTTGVITVKEKIYLYAAGGEFKRGFVRGIPLYRTDADGKNVKVKVDVKNVYLDGAPATYFTEKDGGELMIYIGEEDVYLTPNFYTYTIEYETPGMVGFFDGYDEISWNVNYPSPQVMDKVSANVFLPDEAEILSYRCYSGLRGSTEENCTGEQKDSKTLYLETLNLKQNGIFTVYIGFTKGVVSQSILEAYKPPVPKTLFERRGLPLLGMLVLVILIPYYLITWRRYGIDPKKPVVIPQFNPPADLSPAGIGMLLKERFDEDFITSSMVNLAVKGYLKIDEIEKEKGLFGLRKDRYYEVTKVKEASADLPQEEQVLMLELFRSSDLVKLDGQYNEDIAKVMRKYRGNVKGQYDPIVNEGNNRKFLTFPSLLIISYILSLLYFRRFEPEMMSYTFIVSGGVAFTFMSIVSAILGAIFPKWKVPWFGLMAGGGIAIAAWMLQVIFSKENLSENIRGFIVVFPIILLTYLVYDHLIRKPSKKKFEYQAHIKGLKMYMETAEEKRLQYFNPPEMTPKVFEELLPYAIALNMGKIWGEKFEKTFKASTQMENSTMYQPTWYSGSLGSPAKFGQLLNSTLSNTFNHTASQASSGSSGGGNWSSGSFGGGYSGGGGGGGSGGGW